MDVVVAVSAVVVVAGCGCLAGWLAAFVPGWLAGWLGLYWAGGGLLSVALDQHGQVYGSTPKLDCLILLEIELLD